MTKQLNLGAPRPLKPLRAGLCAAIALLFLQAPLAHADAFGSPKGNTASNKELMDRLSAMEQRLAAMAQRDASNQSPGAPGAFNMPTPPGMPPMPVSDDELELGYERKGELNGYVLLKRNGRVQAMSRMDFERFEAEAKAKARLQLTKAAMSAQMPLAPPANNMPAMNPPVPSAKPAQSFAPAPNLNAAAVRAAKANPASAASPMPMK